MVSASLMNQKLYDGKRRLDIINLQRILNFLPWQCGTWGGCMRTESASLRYNIVLKHARDELMMSS